MLRSMRVRLMLAFVAVVAVAVGIAEVAAERMATREFDSYVSRVDAAYLETLAQNLGDYYAENGSWQNVEPVFLTLPQAPGHLQLQDSSGGIVADTSPGRGPGGGGGGGGSPAGPVGGPSAPGSGGPASLDTPETGADAGPTVTPGAGPSGSGGSGEPVGTPTPAGPAGPGGANTGPDAGSTATPAASPSGPADHGGPVSTPSAPRPAGPDAGPSATPSVIPRSTAKSDGAGGIEAAPGGGGPRGSDETEAGTGTNVMVLAESAMASGRSLVAEATPTAQGTQSIPIYASGEQVGTLVVLTQQDVLPISASLGDRFFDRVRLALLVGGITALLVAFVFALLLVDGITRPLRRLAHAARRVAAGDFSQRVDVSSPSEAAELAGSFNRMAEALERDKDTRHRLLADIAHELRTPLSVIQGTAQGFLDGVIPPDQEHAAVVRDEATLLSKLITDLRDLSLAEAGELRLERKPSDVGELVRQAAAGVRHRAREQGIDLEVAAPAGLPSCLLDSQRTSQILGNLLNNALRHTPRGGHVALRVRQPEGDRLMVDVEDTGEGIPPEHLPHIFERFYRVDSSRTRGGGTGLGLAIAKQLARAQGGDVTAESTPGQGSVFRVSVPVASPEAGGPASPRHSA